MFMLFIIRLSCPSFGQVVLFLSRWKERDKKAIDETKEFEKISIVISAYNEEETIEEVLLSLRNLNYPSLEIFIVDDKSSDRTLEKLYEVKKIFRRLGNINYS
jgi:poly-beta-1,6-N-acetyl-D-glucosamine synthase